MATSRTSRPAATVPRRDAHGRVVSLPELLGVAALFAVVNGVGLLAIDGVLALARISSFGDSSGWLVAILPALLYFEDFRAWRAMDKRDAQRAHRLRWLAAAVALLVGGALGLVAAGLVDQLPALASGAVGALVAVLAYAPVWFLGVRRLTGAPVNSKEQR